MALSFIPLPRELSTAKLFILCFIFSLKLSGYVWLKNSIHERLSPLNIDDPRVFPMKELEPVRMFIEDTTHFDVDGPSGTADAEWESMIPGGGIVYLGKDHRQPYTISMFHQIRCVDIIRREIVQVEGSGRTQSAIPSELSHHCINYLRQIVLCRSDVELDVVLGKPRPNVYPNLYQCKDWTSVYEAVEKHQRENGPGSRL